MIPGFTNHLWQSTLFAVAAGILTVAFRRNRAHVRYWLWFSASFKFLVPFALLISLGSHLRWAPETRATVIETVSVTMEQIAQPFPATSPFAPAPRSVNWVPAVILCVWVSGFLAITLMRLRAWRRVQAAVRSSAPLDISAGVGIRSAPGLLEPGVVGLLRPILLMPGGLADVLTPAQLESVLAHELCHVRRRDNLLSFLHMAVEAVFWFHPLVWWIGARLVEERERACDEEVLRLGSEPRVYADAILNVCKLYVESPLVCVSGVTGASLKGRIEAIMMNKTAQGLNRAKKLLLAGAGVVALAGPVAIGVMIEMGHAPVVLAQPPLAIPSIVNTIPAAVVAQQVPARPAPVSLSAQYQDRRLLAILLDFGGMTSEQQSNARENAVNFIHNQFGATDMMAIMTTDNGKAKIVQDFTNDRTILESALLGVQAGAGSSSVPGRLSGIESAANLLSALPQKKSLLYFSGGIEQAGSNYPAEMQSAISAAVKANVALYAILTRGLIPQLIGSGGRSMTPRSQLTGVSQEEYTRRVAEAQRKFGSTSGAMSRAYIKYGPPDQIEDRATNAQSTQIWHYNYLDSFHNSAEFEFSQGGLPQRVYINWPPPLATYQGVADGAAGLPGRRSSFQTYPAGELSTLTVPLDSLSSRVEIEGQIDMRPKIDATGRRAVVRDNVDASVGTYQAHFMLEAGSYVCRLTVTEKATGHTYEETIDFEVK